MVISRESITTPHYLLFSIADFDINAPTPSRSTSLLYLFDTYRHFQLPLEIFNHDGHCHTRPLHLLHYFPAIFIIPSSTEATHAISFTLAHQICHLIHFWRISSCRITKEYIDKLLLFHLHISQFSSSFSL